MQEASFKEFLQRPENRPLVEAHQRKEVRQALRMKEKARALEFQEKVRRVSARLPGRCCRACRGKSLLFKLRQVLDSDYEAQKSIAPYLSSRVLRLIIQTFTNDELGDFSKWACNPVVLEMLGQAQQLLREGRMSEEELEHALLAQLEVLLWS